MNFSGYLFRASNYISKKTALTRFMVFSAVLNVIATGYLSGILPAG